MLLTLFIGVATTSMEEAQSSQECEFKLERQMKTLQASLVQMIHFKEVFNKFDIYRRGTIDEEELIVGLRSIKDLLAGSFEVFKKNASD